jgi:RsiW-degrading membrane proteinase PrsW (M82 family)
MELLKMAEDAGVRRFFTFKSGLIGDAGTTVTILILVFILTVVLGGTLLLLLALGDAFTVLMAFSSFLLIPIVIVVGIFTNTILPRWAESGRDPLMRTFARVNVPPEHIQDSYRMKYIAQKFTTFSISIVIFFVCLIIATLLFLIPFSVNPICLICLPVSFPIMLVTLTMPAIAWLSFGYAFDPYEPEPRGFLVMALLWGMLSTFPSLFLNSANAIWMDEELVSLFSAPIVEETFKCLGFVLIFSQIRDETDGVLYGILFGSGFALIENFLYSIGVIVQAGGIGFFFLAGFRSFFNMAIHIVGPAIVGFSIGMIRSRMEKRPHFGRKGTINVSDLLVPLVAIPMLIVGMFNHLLWNFLAGLGSFFFLLLMMMGVLEFAGLIGLVLIGFLLATGRISRDRRSKPSAGPEPQR